AVEDGRLSQADLDKCVKRVLELIVRTPRFNGYVATNNPDLEAHARLTRDVASEGFVLLKNDNNALPLKMNDTIALFGATSYDFIAGGHGSGDVNKAYVIDLRQGLVNGGFTLNQELDSVYLKHIARERSRMAPIKAVRKWYLTPLRPNEITDSYKLAADAADASDVAIITIGRNSGEGYDRHVERDFNLHINEQALIKAVSRKFHSQGKKVVVVLNVCGPVETASWRDDVDAILLCWEPGQEGGNSVADVMSGKVSPSGHLPVTFPVNYSEVSALNFPTNVPETGVNQSYENVCRSHKPYDIPNIDYTNYTEDIYVGYRNSATKGIKDAYPFGHGLTYTTFDMSDMKVKRHDNGFKVTCKIKNTGDRSAKQVVQLYSTELSPATDRPAIELRAYKKTPELKPGESYTVEMQLNDDDLATFSENDMAWKVAKGQYKLSLGYSSADLPLSQTVTVNRDKLTPVRDVMKPVSGDIFINQ
ncbi:MAG: glycoside hydrolase family 3 C-terminal domain-containing protein, partial [Muribaculaceae bacterium]|nr:glycoside hydrolase family 3 C-terminal domain-containing protein [Muribaculaceae bacterium]